MDQAIIYTDGGCSGNPGPGGYAYVISLLGGAEEVLGSGGEANTTNNRMELRAVISALSELERRSPGAEAVVRTDSQYVKNGIGTWIASWKRNGWRTADKKSVKNKELWEAARRRRRAGPSPLRVGQGPRGHRGQRALRRDGPGGDSQVPLRAGGRPAAAYFAQASAAGPRRPRSRASSAACVLSRAPIF